MLANSLSRNIYRRPSILTLTTRHPANSLTFLPPSTTSPQLYLLPMRFIGKTENWYKFKTPKLRMRCVNHIYPPPGNNLTLPADLDVETYFRQIGGDCEEYADKFETLDQVFKLTGSEMKELGVPVH